MHVHIKNVECLAWVSQFRETASVSRELLVQTSYETLRGLRKVVKTMLYDMAEVVVKRVQRDLGHGQSYSARPYKGINKQRTQMTKLYT